MKKMRVLLLSAAILLAVGGAFAKAKFSCENQPQFYRVAWFYLPAGELGINYFCWTSVGTCTYYQPNPITKPYEFLPCKTGAYFPIL